MELESLVEKITREVMDSLKEKGSPPSSSGLRAPSSSAPSFSGSKTAVLLAGSPGVDAAVVREAVSYLRKNNYSLTLAISPGAPSLSLDGVTVIRCGYTNDCSASLRGSDVVIILLPDIATISRLANLICDRFDIEAAISGLESGKSVIGLNVMGEVSAALKAKVDKFFREIESYGIKVTKAEGIVSVPASVSVSKSSAAPVPAACSMMTDGDCAGCGLCTQFIANKVQDVVDTGADRISGGPGLKLSGSDIGRMIDHTLLKADATRDEIIKLCEEARKYTFASCCVNPGQVALTAECLKGSPVKVCTVIGFPLGATTSMVKAMETRDAIAAGADEIDMVINVGALKAGDLDLVRRDIESVVNAADGHIVKVIIEAALLTDEEKIKACQLSKQAGADFVKTSTGFGPGGATAHDVALMRQTVGKYMGVKASGGIRDFAKADEMIKAGATRIGASASVAIVKGDKAKAGSGY